EQHVIVCTGPGGVGKTTTAASLALRAADEGRTVIVCTIDPAKRLAQSLGLEELDNEPKPVPAKAFKGRKPKGELWAMMLDTKRTFDEMVLDMTTPDRAEKIFENSFYQHISSSLSGTQEYMAMEKLFELHEEGRWSLIVIDTPPTRNALDFLDAPRKLTDFLDSRFLRALLWPTIQAGKSTFRAFNMGAKVVLRAATRITGSELLSDVASFFAAFDGMYGSFKHRAERVREMLSAKRTSFVVVAAPQVASLREARFFVDRLRAEQIPLGGVVINRTHLAPPVLDDPRELAERATKSGEAPLLAAALEVYASWQEIAEREARAIEDALGGAQLPPLWGVPDFADEVHSVPALRRLSDHLLGPVVPSD
ncbi:MAG TPA: ArsA family ATPase, partial [Actinomycetota bacterium]|nr:ArsA family ATPase [Actinomycetota bacterium]